MKKLLSAILEDLSPSVREALIPISLFFTDILLVLVLRNGLLEAPLRIARMIPWSMLGDFDFLQWSDRIQIVEFILLNFDILIFLILLINFFCFWLYFKNKLGSRKLIHYVHIPLKVLITLLTIPFLNWNEIWIWLSLIILIEIGFIFFLVKTSSHNAVQPANKLM